MLQYDLVIVGSGASGLIAGITALKEGVQNVIILEKEDSLGGNLNLFINDGFGEYYLGESVTGPEFASILIDEYINLGGEYKINSSVLKINEEKILRYLNPKEGLCDIKARAIILASGCREKYTGNIIVPIHKYTGIFTTGSAHKLVNYRGYLPGKNVVLSGSNIWTFILARRLLIEGARVKAVVVNEEIVDENVLEIIQGFKVPIIYNSRIVEVGGSERIEWVKLESSLEEEPITIPCNSLVLSIGYYPEIDYLKDVDLKRTGLFLATNNYETSISNIYCVGTISKGIDGLFNSGEDSLEVGKLVAERLKGIN